MKLKFQIKHDGTLYKVGDYPGKNKRLPGKVEQSFIERGYFEAAVEGKPQKETTELTEAEKIAAMNVADMTAAIAELDAEALQAVLEAEQAGKNRDSAIKAITEKMEGE